MPRDTGFTVVFVLMIALILFIAVLPVSGVGALRAESTYTGYVVDVEHEKGMILRTTQIKMKTHPRSSAVESFCVITDDGVGDLERARRALREQYRVRVTYERPFWVHPQTCQTGLSIVQDINPTNATAEEAGA